MLVANWICSYVLNDMLAIHQNGTRMTRRNRAMPVHVRAFNGSPPLKWGGAAPLLPHTPPPH